MKSRTQSVQYAALFLITIVVAVVLWKQWVPNFPWFESPGWDESDRARDAALLNVAIRNFDLWPIIQQVLFFGTWGPLYSVFAQVPLFLFGPTAHSLSFVSFFSFIAAPLAFLLCSKEKLGWLSAIAIAAFTAFWLAGLTKYGPYWIIFMLEGWSIFGWMGVALAGALSQPMLLVISAWILFATKYQYYPIFFVATVLYFAVRKYFNLKPFLKDLLAPTWAKALLALIGLIVVHILIMKLFGPIYGKPNWNQPRSLRNPVLVSFILSTLFVYLQRGVFFKYIITDNWENTFVRHFFFPATVFMAFPWPNRWAAVLVTQNYTSKASLLEVVATYWNEMLETWRWPVAAASLLAILVAVWAVTYLRKFNRKNFGVFVTVIIATHILVLIAAVNNLQGRFGVVVFASIATPLFAAILASLNPKIRNVASAAALTAIVAIFAFTNYFEPQKFFFGALTPHVGKTYLASPGVFPLEESLRPAFSLGGKQMHIAILGTQKEWEWDRPFAFFPAMHKARTGQDVTVTIITKDENYCEVARAAKVDVFIEPAGNNWASVKCTN